MINALEYMRRLEQAGFSREQAETQVQFVTEIVEGDLVTKQDLKNTVEILEHKMLQMEYRLIIKLGAMMTVTAGVIVSLVKIL